jgi:chromosome segregation ATPase
MIEAVRVSFCPGIRVHSAVPFEQTKFAFGVQTLNVISSNNKSLPQPSSAKFNNFKKKIYRKRIKANKKKVRKNLDKAMSYKSRLNELEDRNKSGKDRALDSYMNKRRKAEAKLASGKYDKDDFADKMEELEDSFSERPSIDGEAQSGLQEVSKKYRTFDTEILEMIEGMPEEDRKDRDIDTYAKILGRNSKSKQVEKEQPMVETYLSEEYDLADMDPAKIDELKKDPETYKQYLEEKEKQQAAKEAYERIKKLQPEIAKALEEGKTIKTPIPEPVKDDSTAEK